MVSLLYHFPERGLKLFNYVYGSLDLLPKSPLPLPERGLKLFRFCFYRIMSPLPLPREGIETGIGIRIGGVVPPPSPLPLPREGIETLFGINNDIAW